MPGIVGIIGKAARGKHERDLKLMMDCMMHEPFYRSGSYVNEELGVCVGWTCYPGSFADCMPIVNAKKDLVLLFSGEHFDDSSNTQKHNAAALLQRFEEKGDSFLRQLNGWFAGILVDLRNATVTLFNDRYGMQRIYYHEAKDAFLFGSEAKSLLKVRPELRDLDMRGLGELVSCNCVVEGRTLFPKISLLPGGAAWVWKKSRDLSKRVYFRPTEWESLPPLDEETFSSRLSETVKNIVPRYAREKGKVGMSLTGGLDSRMMMACLNPSPGELPCYTFGGDKDMLDITIARKIAEVCNQTHTVIRLGSSFFTEFPRLAEKTVYVTDGSLDVINSHDMYFNKLAYDIAPIRLTGKFGSEVIRDHTMFNAGKYEERLFHRDLNAQIQKAVHTLGEVKQGHPLSVAVFKDFPWREYNKIAVEQSQCIFRSPYMDNDLIELMYQAPLGLRSSNHPQRQIIKQSAPKLSAMISDRGYGQGKHTLPAKLIELYHYALFKMDYIYVSALPHWLTRVDALCMSVNGRRPMFGSSQKFEFYRIWFRDKLSTYVKDILLDPLTTTRPYFEKKSLEMMVQAHTRGTRNYMYEINKAMTVELTHRLLIAQ